MENPELTVELTLNEINMILASLGKHPFDEVVALVSKIKLQGEAQIQALQTQPSEEATEE
jgi:hypothetical protein